MKGKPEVIEALNQRISEELAAILQYMVHAELLENWGYTKLAEIVEKRAIKEMEHWEKLVARIIFLEGQPKVTAIAPVHIAQDVEKIHERDLEAEYGAQRAYNDTIKLAAELGDNGTKVLLEEILRDEEEHIDWLEAQLDEIRQMGLAAYLSRYSE
jgi:bacterioferritin